VWAVSLMSILLVYVLYSQLSRTPRIEIDTLTELDEAVGEFDNKTGKIGEVGVGTVKKARFLDFNEEKEVIGEWGFKKLLYKTGDEWELDRPYRNIFKDDYTCYVTSDKGRVRVETVANKSTPKDATLEGNVKIHILPKEGSSVKESTIYLDNVVFVSERSLFATAGPIKIVSEEMFLLGRGMELIYNEQQAELEYLKIIRLDSLEIKRSSESEKTAEDNEQDAGQQKNETADGAEIEKGPAEQKARVSYKCVFRKNVIIELAEQVAFTEELVINNISSGEKDDAEKSDEPAAQDEQEVLADAGKENIGKEDAGSEAAEDETSVEDSNVIVTCDGEVEIWPMDSTKRYQSIIKLADEDGGDKRDKKAIEQSKRATFKGRKIEYCMLKDTAVLEGDGRCTMVEEVNDVVEKYTLSAPTIEVKMAKAENKRPSGLAPDIEHLTASGKWVMLATVKKTKEDELLGGMQLKCAKFDYDGKDEVFVATGPGVIVVDNSKIVERDKQEGEKKGEREGKFNLQKPCYAFVRNFTMLKYLFQENQIIADAELNGTLNIDYIPVVDGVYGQQISATAKHITANLIKNSLGQNKLSTVKGTGGVTYDEEAKDKKWGKRKDIQFLGSGFFYDANTSVMTAWGDDVWPCVLNGAQVKGEGIEYDAEKDVWKEVKIVGPGVIF